MNDEIKEILIQLEYFIEEGYEYYNDIKLNKNQMKQLLDYITNLQQENERLKEENNNKAMNDYAHAIDESWYRELYDDYKSRCEKASKFIKEKISSTKGVINDYMYHKEHNKQLIQLLNEDIEMYKKELNILQNGSESNE